MANEEDWNAEEVGAARGQPTRRAEAPKYIPRRRLCAFCTDKIEVIDYKQPDLLRRFLTERGKIKPRRQTGTCAKHQRRLALAVKRARHLALLPFAAEHLRRYG